MTKNNTMCIRVPVELRVKLKKKAKKEYKTESQVIRDCLALFLSKNITKDIIKF